MPERRYAGIDFVSLNELRRNSECKERHPRERRRYSGHVRRQSCCRPSSIEAMGRGKWTCPRAVERGMREVGERITI